MWELEAKKVFQMASWSEEEHKMTYSATEAQSRTSSSAGGHKQMFAKVRSVFPDQMRDPKKPKDPKEPLDPEFGHVRIVVSIVLVRPKPEKAKTPNRSQVAAQAYGFELQSNPAYLEMSRESSP